MVYKVWFDDFGRERLQFIMPNKKKHDILIIAHEREVAGHYGVKKTVAKVREGVYWYVLLSDVRKYCRSCDICQRRKLASNRPHHKLR